MLILNTSITHNTPWQHNYRNTVIKEERNIIHMSITKLKVQNYKALSNLGKTVLINSFSFFKIRSAKPPLYRPTKWLKTFNK